MNSPRKWHNYLEWEEFRHGMWRKVSKQEEEELLSRAIEFTGDAKLYGEYMRRVIEEWPVSCEQHLGDQSINRQAWVGHAACCLAIRCPEYITHRAWWHLSAQQQNEANNEASQAIKIWEAAQQAKREDSGQLRLW